MRKTSTWLVLLIVLSVSTCQILADSGRSIKKDTISSKILNEERDIFYVVPENYSATNTYDLLVVLDMDSPDFFHEYFACEDADLSGVIILGIANTIRDKDMFPVYVDERKPKSGGGADFLRFITEEAIPMVENKWSVEGERTIMGFSNSGIFSLYAILNASESFDGCISISPMIGYIPEFMHSQIKEKLGTVSSFNKTIYIDQGEDDFDYVVDFLPEYVEVLEETAPNDLQLEYRVFRSFGHVSKAAICSSLHFYFGKQASE